MRDSCESTGSGSGVGPSSNVVGQARFNADLANSRPIRPDERLARYRTASIGSQVGPAVISSRGGFFGLDRIIIKDDMGILYQLDKRNNTTKGSADLMLRFT